MGVLGISWVGALVQAEEAPGRQQRRSEGNCDGNQAKGCQRHKVRYEILMEGRCGGAGEAAAPQVWLPSPHHKCTASKVLSSG